MDLGLTEELELLQKIVRTFVAEGLGWASLDGRPLPSMGMRDC